MAQPRCSNPGGRSIPPRANCVHDFTDPELDTRFLGDLYQDLSEAARRSYALLQTPVFVEEFILDRTLTPAIKEFGLAESRSSIPPAGRAISCSEHSSVYSMSGSGANPEPTHANSCRMRSTASTAWTSTRMRQPSPDSGC